MQESRPTEFLEDVEIIPLQQLSLAEVPRIRSFQSLDSLPDERWYETDGVAPAKRCPVQIDPIAKICS